MRFAFVGGESGDGMGALAEEVRETLLARGHELVDAHAGGAGQADLVFNLTDPEEPRAHYVRPDASMFVASLVESRDGDRWADREALRAASYGMLVKTMSNVVVHRVRAGRHGRSAHYVTPELGFRSTSDEDGLAAAIAEFVTPFALARVVIENRLDEDLPPALWEGDAAVESLIACGRELAGMNLLPSVFDLSTLLDERDRRMLQKVFGIKQLSYGNLSVRSDASTFWMTGRGADKGRLRGVGHDVFRVKGYDPEQGCILLSVPPGSSPEGRVSVDAIEHFKIYAALPEVGAVVHVHAWMPGVQATTQSWPCGTEPMADDVLGILRSQPDPACAVAGLKNHGLTLTGRSLEDVFRRIRGRLTQDVPVLD